LPVFWPGWSAASPMSVTEVPSPRTRDRRFSSSSTTAPARVAGRASSISSSTRIVVFISSLLGRGRLVHEDEAARVPAGAGEAASALQLPGDHVAVFERVEGQGELHGRGLTRVLRAQHHLLAARGSE